MNRPTDWPKKVVTVRGKRGTVEEVRYIRGTYWAIVRYENGSRSKERLGALREVS